MTLFTTLLVLIVEHLFKLGEHWQLDHRIEAFFRRIKRFSMMHVVGMTLIAMGVTFLLLHILHGLLFNVPLLVAWILIGLLCIGTGKTCLHYHAYLNAVARDDVHARDTVVSELALIHGVLPDCDEREFLCEPQNVLLWNNFYFYPASLFWLTVDGPWGSVMLVDYAFSHAWWSWLARYQTPHQHLQSGIDAIPYVLDWIPVHLAGAVYALPGHGKKALPARLASLADLHTSQYQVFTRLTQFSLARKPHTDKVKTLKAAALLVKETSSVVVVAIAVPTIYGVLV